MGFSQMRIVGSDQHLQKKARILAHGAQDVLDNITRYDDLPSALEDIDWVIGTSAKRRLGKRYNYSAPELTSLLAGKGDSVRTVAVVFGCEESGLSNDQLDCCDALSSIPIAQSYPSLNLAQAVMIFAYSLSNIVPADQSGGAVRSMVRSAEENVEQGSWNVLKEKVVALLNDLEVASDDKLHAWARERLSALTQKDVDFFHRLLGKITGKINQGRKRDS